MSTGIWAYMYEEVLSTYKPYSTLIFDANDVSRKLADCLKTCLNPPRGRGEKRIGTLASEDDTSKLSILSKLTMGNWGHGMGWMMAVRMC